MAGVKVCHIVNSFDPSGDVARCVRELNLHSAHSHTLYVKDRHPLQSVYQFEEPERTDPGRLVAEADVLIHHFTGWEDGAGDSGKPSAFRNVNIYFDKEGGRFWSSPEYNARSYDRYKLVASSHVGASDFMPADRFRWLPDLLPLDGAYSFDPAPRPRPAVSYIKHAEELRLASFPDGVTRLDCSETPHGDVLSRRRSLASVVIDNVSDGHYGLAGQEAAIFGLPVVVFNHKRTLDAMSGWDKPGTESPFIQAVTVEEAADKAGRQASQVSLSYRRAVRQWAEEFLSPLRLISKYWDPFIKELAA